VQDVVQFSNLTQPKNQGVICMLFKNCTAKMGAAGSRKKVKQAQQADRVRDNLLILKAINLSIHKDSECALFPKSLS